MPGNAGAEILQSTLHDPGSGLDPVGPGGLAGQDSAGAPLDLLSPCRLHIRVPGLVQAGEQLGGHIGSLLGGQLQGFVDQVRRSGRHARILQHAPLRPPAPVGVGLAAGAVEGRVIGFQHLGQGLKRRAFARRVPLGDVGVAPLVQPEDPTAILVSGRPSRAAP